MLDVAHARLHILNMLPESEWRAQRDRPRFVQPQVHSTDPCRDCAGGCCSADIRLTTVEALRLSTALALPVLDMVRLVPAEQEGDSRFPAIPLADGDVRLMLRRNDTTSLCIFHHALGERGRCSVHGLRPGVCRLYPFHMRVGTRTVEVGNQGRCPVAWVKTDALEQRAAADLRQWDADLKTETRLLTAWGKAPKDDRSATAFFTFALRRLARALGVDAEELLAPPPRRAFRARLW